MTNDTTSVPIGADALRVAAQAALTALENLHEIDTETECITIDVRDEIDALRAALASTAQPAVVAPTVEQVEEAVGMGHGAWDCIAPDELIAAVLRLAAAPKVALAAQGDALIDFIESAGSVHIYRVRAGLNGPIRWDVEYGYEDAKVSGRTLRDALSGVLKAGAARAAKEGDHDGPL